MDTSTVETAKHTSSRGGKRLRTIDEKRRIVEETFHSGESVAAIARRHDVNANLVFSWRRLYQKGLLEPAASSAALVPVTIEAAAVGKRLSGRRAMKANALQVSAECVEIDLGAGKSMRVHGKLALAFLDRFLAGLCTR
jgi:transposase